MRVSIGAAHLKTPAPAILLRMRMVRGSRTNSTVARSDLSCKYRAIAQIEIGVGWFRGAGKHAASMTRVNLQCAAISARHLASDGLVELGGGCGTDGRAHASGDLNARVPVIHMAAPAPASKPRGADMQHGTSLRMHVMAFTTMTDMSVTRGQQRRCLCSCHGMSVAPICSLLAVTR